jgi:hypothetical protein
MVEASVGLKRRQKTARWQQQEQHCRLRSDTANDANAKQADGQAL